MKIKIEKPKESIWKFPCFGIHEKTCKIVAFMDDKKGVIVEKGYGVLSLGHYREDWEMIQFKPYTPTETKQQSIDWDNVELPIWLLYHGNLLTISDITGKHMRGFVLKNNGRVVKWDYICDNIKNRNDYLNSLEILPKGTKITFEL